MAFLRKVAEKLGFSEVDDADVNLVQDRIIIDIRSFKYDNPDDHDTQSNQERKVDDDDNNSISINQEKCEEKIANSTNNSDTKPSKSSDIARKSDEAGVSVFTNSNTFDRNNRLKVEYYYCYSQTLNI